MRKLITVILILALILPAAALAEAQNPFKDYTMEQLYMLLSIVQSEILSRSEWKEVTVPPGNYVIGEDIPAGHWTIKYAPGEISIIEYFQNANHTGIEPADSLYDLNTWGIVDPTHELSSLYDRTEIDLQLTEGYHLNVTIGPAIFVPFTGRTSPFFNK